MQSSSISQTEGVQQLVFMNIRKRENKIFISSNSLAVNTAYHFSAQKILLLLFQPLPLSFSAHVHYLAV